MHRPSLTGDYPRVGGEKDAQVCSEIVEKGSPPRGRGKVLAAGLHNLIDRITPAWAGKSCTALRRFVRCGDHPRVGGEKMNKRYEEGRKPGSPPRGRGKVMLFTLLPMGRGITPAWAGKSKI